MLGAIILAGGKGKRIGGDKPLTKLGSKELILHVCEAVEIVSDELVVVVNRSEDIEIYKLILPEGVELTTDFGRVGGPLVGICSGLRRMRSEYALVLPCDTPFVNVPVLRYLAECSKGYDAAVPCWPNGYMEPLHSVYRVEPSIRACGETMAESNFRISGMISRLRTMYVPVEEVRRLDPELLTFFNVNSQEDLKKAEEILKSRN